MDEGQQREYLDMIINQSNSVLDNVKPGQRASKHDICVGDNKYGASVVIGSKGRSFVVFDNPQANKQKKPKEVEISHDDS